jgi:hypothetical protein
MTEQPDIPYVDISTENTFTFHTPKQSNWKCYMFGNRPDANYGIVYIPQEGRVPNFFVRWMMRICFDCYWVKNK